MTVSGNLTVSNNFVYTQNGASAFTQFDGVFNDTLSSSVQINNINGAMNLNGTVNTAAISNDRTMLNSGVINSGTIINNSGGLMTLNGTTIAAISNAGNMIIDGAVTGDLSNDGTLSGSGTVTGNVTNGGVFNPGNSPGTFTIDGDLNLLDSSVLNIDIAGLVKGEYDELIVTGNINFNGRLNIIVDSSAGYTGNLQDSFDPITYNTGSGDLILTASRGYGYDLTIDTNTLNLLTTSVPGLFVPDTQSDIVTLIGTTQNITNIEIMGDVEAELVRSEDEDEDEKGNALVCS